MDVLWDKNPPFILIVLFNFLTPGVGSSLFQQFKVVLVKLRLNVGDQDLAFRCGVISQSSPDT